MACLIPYDYTNLGMMGVDGEKYFITEQGLRNYICHTILKDVDDVFYTKPKAVDNFMNEIHSLPVKTEVAENHVCYKVGDFYNAIGFDLNDLLGKSSLSLYLDEDDIREANSEWDA